MSCTYFECTIRWGLIYVYACETITLRSPTSITPHLHKGAYIYVFIYAFHLFYFLGPHPQHMEVPRLGVESELQLLAYTRAIATWDPSRICNLHHSARQCWIPDPLSEAKDQTRMDTSRIYFLCSTTTGTLQKWHFNPYSLVVLCSSFQVRVKIV